MWRPLIMLINETQSCDLTLLINKTQSCDLKLLINETQSCNPWRTEFLWTQWKNNNNTWRFFLNLKLLNPAESKKVLIQIFFLKNAKCCPLLVQVEYESTFIFCETFPLKACANMLRIGCWLPRVMTHEWRPGVPYPGLLHPREIDSPQLSCHGEIPKNSNN